MTRFAAALLFAFAYAFSLVAVAELNADYILRDAVIGTLTVALFYSAFLAPAALAAVGTLTIARMGTRLRFSLAAIFALSIGVAVEILFASAQSQAFTQLQRFADATLFTATNVILVCAFIAVGVVTHRRSARAQIA
jgi:hypothetical protein